MSRTDQNVTTSVLVVDDEAMVRLCAVAMLEDAGFLVIGAADAEEALDLLAIHPEISVLFTDINMPGAFDGLELARRVHAQRPDMQLIITSGRGQPSADDMVGGHFVFKPYDVGHISGLIRTATSLSVDRARLN